MASLPGRGESINQELLRVLTHLLISHHASAVPVTRPILFLWLLSVCVKHIALSDAIFPEPDIKATVFESINNSLNTMTVI